MCGSLLHRFVNESIDGRMIHIKYRSMSVYSGKRDGKWHCMCEVKVIKKQMCKIKLKRDYVLIGSAVYNAPQT